MAHKAGLLLGKITLNQYIRLGKLKMKDPEAYEKLEYKWGTTRKQLVAEYGEDAVARVEATGRVIHGAWKTNKRTAQRFRN
jgi:hypothetical protein